MHLTNLLRISAVCAISVSSILNFVSASWFRAFSTAIDIMLETREQKSLSGTISTIMLKRANLSPEDSSYIKKAFFILNFDEITSF